MQAHAQPSWEVDNLVKCTNTQPFASTKVTSFVVLVQTPFLLQYSSQNDRNVGWKGHGCHTATPHLRQDSHTKVIRSAVALPRASWDRGSQPPEQPAACYAAHLVPPHLRCLPKRLPASPPCLRNEGYSVRLPLAGHQGASLCFTRTSTLLWSSRAVCWE